MAVKSSGSLSMKTDIVGEFGGTAPHGLKEYYRGGSEVPDTDVNSSVPESGAIGLKDFYGSRNQQTVTLTSEALVNGQSNRKQITVSSFINTGDILIIPSNFWVWSDDRTVAALTIDIPCTIQNSGKVIGRGGNGARARHPAVAAQSGGPAIKINANVSDVTIINNSGAYIAGGGGGGGSSQQDGYSAGGGGGAGGGTGGVSTYATGGAGGALNSAGENGTTYVHTDGEGTSRSYYSGRGGEAGGGGSNADYDGGNKGAGAGGGGGRILPGVLGTASNGVNTGAGRGGGENWQAGAGAVYSSAHGGVAGNAAPNYNGVGGAAGGGGWGAKGGNARDGSYASGGAGGKAIEDSGNTYTLTDNGTIYGATT